MREGEKFLIKSLSVKPGIRKVTVYYYFVFKSSSGDCWMRQRVTKKSLYKIALNISPKQMN